MKLIFFAKILPERFALTAPEKRYQATVPAFNLSYEARLSIYVGQATVQMTTDGPQLDIETTRNIIERDIRSFVDIYGFFHGVRFDVDMVSVVDDVGNWRVFGIDIPVLKQSLQGPQDELLRKYFSVAVSRPECAIVMADFREAMRNPPNTGFHCYRAIEAMMQSIKEEPTEKDNKSWAWERFRNDLRIDRACLDAIKVHADPPRHGKPHAMTDAERAYVFGKTQDIVIRFLEYLSRREQPLPEADFPTLQA